MEKIVSKIMTFICAVFLALSANGVHAELPDWPALYDTSTVLDLNVKLREGDWETIKSDDTFDIEVPALFWASQDGGEETAILVSIRRKSATPIGDKVSYKIDINEYEDDDSRATSKWHDVKKLSLENGDDADVVSEGLAWFMHRLAVDTGVYPVGHRPGMANWATITFHLAADCAVEPCGFFEIGETLAIADGGLFLNVEQPDKQFLKNRGEWVGGETWLYKQDEQLLPPEVKEAGCDPESDFSPARTALQCAPFLPPEGKGKGAIKPADCDLDLIDDLVDMSVLLATGAANTVAGNPDELLNHEKNFFSVDFSTDGICTQPPVFEDMDRPLQRLHYPWDLDEAIANINQNIYGKPRKHRGQFDLVQTAYQRVLLQDSDGFNWRTQYNTNLLVLTDVANVGTAHDFLDDMEVVLTPFLLDDPNSKIANPSGHFAGLRSWVTGRAVIIRDQVCADDPSLLGC